MSRALSSLPGVQAVTVDLAHRKVTVSHDPSVVSLETMKGAIAAAGYALEA